MLAENLDPYAHYVFQRNLDTLDWDAMAKMLK